jgi:RHS repeat-associated protein
MSDAAGAQAWSFDVGGRVVADRRTTNSVTKSFSYAYNLIGGLTTLSYPSGRMITYTYNDAGRLFTGKDVSGGVNYATGPCAGTGGPGACYEPHGALRSLHQGASIVATYYYNNRLQPCRISAKYSGTAPTNCADTTNIGNIVDFSYNFDSDPAAGVQNNGNVGAIANNITPARSQSFTYDELNRIATAKTQATTGQYCWGETFSYDIWANLKTIGALAGYTGCTQESLSVTITNLNQISGHSYDAAGNLTSAPGMGSYTWDAESRMKATAGVTYSYDGDGRRVKKSNGKLYWYSLGLDVLLETDAAGNTPDEYIFFGGKRIARRQSSGTVSYYFSDHLGTSRVVTNTTGTILDDSDYYPFGGERVVVNNDPNQYKFTGKERDTESGLDNFGARYYASTLGRFVKTDPLYLELRRLIDPQQLNLYTYTRNNPLRFTDPTGLDIKITCEEKKDCKQTVEDLNKREDAQFQVKQGKNGLLEVKGKVDPSKLSNSELALYEAIKDKDNHATLNVVRQSDEVDFDRFDGNGTNRIDRSDMNLLAKQDQSLAGHIVAHAALEAYANARYGVGYELGSLVGAHGYASNFFPGAEIAGPLVSGTSFQMGFIFPTKVIDVRGTVTSPQPEFRGNITQVEVRRIP